MLLLQEYRDMVRGGERSPLEVPAIVVDFGLPAQDVRQFLTVAVSRKPAIILDESVFASSGAGLYPIEKSGRNPYDGFVFVGRGSTSDIVLRHHSISKSHAFFAQRDGVWTLADNRSRNGTFSDGERIDPDQPATLSGRMLLTFGTMQVFYFDPDALRELLR